MKLHYKKEHISCTNYKSESYEGFGIGTLTSGSNFNSQTLSVKTNFGNSPRELVRQLKDKHIDNQNLKI